jgi:integrase
VTDRCLNDMRCFRGGLTLSVLKIPFRVFSSNTGWMWLLPHTPIFEEAKIVTFLDSISLDSLKDIRDKAIFCFLLYSWCRVSALTNLSVGDYYERGGTRWLRFQGKRGKDHEVPVH